MQVTGPVPTSIEWYNPQGQLVSRNNRDELNQGAVRDYNRASTLTFRSYQQSRGGTYECRVARPGNDSERLLVCCIGEGQVCIGECHAWGEGCGLLSIIALTVLPYTSLLTHLVYYTSVKILNSSCRAS